MKWLSAFFFLMASTGELRVKASSDHLASLFCKDSVVQPQNLVDGCIWIRSKKKESVQTLHAKAESSESQFHIEYQSGRIYFTNHSGNLKLTLRDGRLITVPAGFSVWVGEIQENKKNQVGMIEPIDVKNHISKLASVWEESASALKAEMKPLIERWGKTHELAAQYYESLVSRKIASIEDAKRKEQNRILNQQLQRQKNQKLLFDRVFNR